MPITPVNRLSDYNFSLRKFFKPPIRSSGKFRSIVLLEQHAKAQPAQQVTSTQNRRSYQEEQFAYFVPGGVDPWGLQTSDTGANDPTGRPIFKSGNTCFVNAKGIGGADINIVVPCPTGPNPPRFPPIIHTGGNCGPHDPGGHPYPCTGGTNVNIWGEGEVPGFTDVQVVGHPDPNKPEDTRPVTSTIPDRTVDVITTRSSPLNNDTLDQMCKMCKDGCTISIVNTKENVVGLFGGQDFDPNGLFGGKIYERFGDRFVLVTPPKCTDAVFAEGDVVKDAVCWITITLGPGDCPCEK